MVLRACAKCHQEDEAPHHFVSGFRMERRNAVLASGQEVEVNYPVDESYHFQCHADMGCEHCQETVDAVDVPEHLVTLEPGEFEADERGVLRRALSKEDARAAREGAAQQAGYDVVDADEADQLHAAHARGELNG